MIRKIIRIDAEKCDGCGLCAKACHEGAIGMVDGKAKLLREDYCDGLGDCLPACPTNAISFEKREAPAYDEKAVRESRQKVRQPGGCPGMRAKTLRHADLSCMQQPSETPSELMQWPVQIKLAPASAPWLKDADLLIAADCTAYAYSGFHEKFMKGRVTLIGCPKLDECDYADKLAAILEQGGVRSVTVVRMEVPCCSGIVNALKEALRISGKSVPWQAVTLSTDGKIL